MISNHMSESYTRNFKAFEARCMYNIDFIPAPSPLQCLDICRIIGVVTRCSQQQQQQQCQAEGL